MPTKLKKSKKEIPELRQDLVSGDWILLASGRAHRPEFVVQKTEERRLPKSNCPFDDPQKSGNKPPVLVYQNKTGTDWFLQVIPNKYPAVELGYCGPAKKTGIYSVREGRGAHEVVILRDHNKHISEYKKEDLKLLFSAYRDRYKSLSNEKCIEYISIFHNYGKEAGASVPHPHSQILALPIVPPDVASSIRGSRDFFHKYNKCVHCLMIEYELKNKKRIVFENKNAIVLAPYASRSNFELRIFPKKHLAFFEGVNDNNGELSDMAEAFHIALAKIYKNLKNPSFNFFLHTAPAIKNLDYSHYHWHFEILPKTSIFGGFDIGTGIDIITVAPETAAKIFRK
ncbi:MAG: galactose-1-phosphate uridylyltransferase [Candidatus Azambacteria bacterium]|nr:galactose-1-phosphate uridylyltransferase [Candidatus Azambacteria bacterium]